MNKTNGISAPSLIVKLLDKLSFGELVALSHIIDTKRYQMLQPEKDKFKLNGD